MSKIGIHISVVLSLITVGIRFAMTAEGFVFDCSIFAILLGIPMFVAIEIFYIVFCIVKKKEVQVILTPYDLFIIVTTLGMWGFIVCAHPTLRFVKTMGNYIETGLIVMTANAFYAMRCYYAIKGNFEKMRIWKMISFVVVPVIAILLAFFFPGLPE